MITAMYALPEIDREAIDLQTESSLDPNCTSFINLWTVGSLFCAKAITRMLNGPMKSNGREVGVGCLLWP
jgi:hypothetical protein